jgi:colicin import membrane protein
MTGFLQEHLRPLAGAAGLHLALVGLLALAAMRWTSSQPPVELAIQGYVAESPETSRPAAGPRSAPPAEAAKPPEPVAEPPQERRAEEAAAAERAAELQRERRQAEERVAQEREAQLTREKAAAEHRKAEAAQAKRKADAEARRKADEEAQRQKVEAAEARRKGELKAQAERDAKAQSDREAELRRALAAEEEGAAVARSGVMDEYRSLLVQTIERNWIRPPSARAGLQCTLYVTQAPGGTVVDVKLGSCNGDQVVRESITTAVYKSSPLPAPRDPRVFERRLEIVFKPTE